eukprot:3212244-Pyramimonas_sp.AAC.1
MQAETTNRPEGWRKNAALHQAKFMGNPGGPVAAAHRGRIRVEGEADPARAGIALAVRRAGGTLLSHSP